MDFGVVVDVETTGLDAQTEQIIEIGLLEFAVEEGKEPAIVGCYGGLEDPGKALEPEIVKITGLTDPLLKGRKIDWPQVRAILDRAAVVVAHNASFDRAFVEGRPELADLNLHWACSMKHIDWAKHGYKTRSLNYLAADHGFLNPFAHRAVFDCATTFRLVAPYLDELVRRSWEREVVIRATGAAFETKDALRQAGYRWDRDARVWTKQIGESQLEAERSFLADEIYGGAPRHEEVLQEP